MAGLLDLYGSDTFTDPQKEALQQRGLLGFLGGLQKSGALDYVAPFQNMRWGSTAAGLAGGAAGMGEAQDAGALNAMRGQLLGLQGQQIRGNLGLLGSEADLMRAIAQRNAAGQGGAPSTAGPSAAAPGGQPGGGDPLNDPRGLIPFITETATKYGIDPAVAVKVASSEGLSNPVGDGGTSHGALQLYTAPGAVGDLFQRTTGLDPSDPANEKATIDFGLKYAAQNGWGAWSGAKKLGLAPFAGIGAAPQGQGVFTAAMGGSGSSAPPQQGLLPASPSADANFNARGQYHDPGLGTWAPPVQQGLLAQPSGNAPAAPGGGLLAQAGQGQPPMPSSQPQPSVAAPPGMSFGGGINMSPAEAQQLSMLQAMRGANTPDFINKTAGLPLVGPTAAAEAGGRYPYEIGKIGEQSKADVSKFYQTLPGEMQKEQVGPAERGSQERQTKAFEVGLQPIQQRNEVLKGEYEKNVVEPFNAAQKALQPLSQIENAMQNFQTGPSAENRLRLMRAWQDLKGYAGMDPNSETAKSIASGEIINKSGTTLGFELARTLGSREAQNIVQQAIKANPSLGNSPEGNRELVSLIKQGLQRDVDKRAFVDDWFNKKMTFAGATEAFNKAKPVESYVSQVLPYKPATPAEAGKLPPGTIFVDPQGVRRQVPAQ